MKRLEVNPNNEKHYTKDFISGFRCGTKRQLESDLIVIDKIRSDVEEIETYDGLYIDRAYVLQIIDKYTKESEGQR